MQTPQELIPALQERFLALGYQPGTPLFRVTVDDLMIVLANRLAEKGIQPGDLTQADLEGLINQVADYLNGEGLPWATVISLGIQDGWPERFIPDQNRQGFQVEET